MLTTAVRYAGRWRRCEKEGDVDERLTDEQVAELRELQRAASGGPWSAGEEVGSTVQHVWNDDGPICEIESHVRREVTDAKLIAAARNALPALLAERDRLRAAVRVLRGALQRIDSEQLVELPRGVTEAARRTLVRELAREALRETAGVAEPEAGA